MDLVVFQHLALFKGLRRFSPQALALLGLQPSSPEACAHLVAFQHLALLERLHGVARVGVALQLHQVHQAHIPGAQLLHPPEVAQLQRAVPCLQLRQLPPGTARAAGSAGAQAKGLERGTSLQLR